MNKVTYIRHRALRFRDDRADRCAQYPHMRMRKWRDTVKILAKKHSGLYKSLRKDARFAAPKLANTLTTECNIDYLALDICRRPLRAHTRALDWKTEWEEVQGLAPWVQSTTAAHPAISNPARIACYPTRADAARNREVVMTPGKFYAAVHSTVEASFVQNFAETYLASKAPLNVHFIDNEKDCDEGDLQDIWMDAYRNPHGFTSCMSDFRASNNHPARFYARPGNGLSLAYITNDGTQDGGIVARSIVHRDRAVYVRCYGDARLARALEARGLECNADAALNKVRCNARDHNGSLVAPYLDGDMQIQWDEESSYCTIVDHGGNYLAQETSGYASGGEDHTSCDECGDGVPDEELAYSSHHDCSVCESCRENNYTTAWVSRTEESLVRDDDVVCVNGTNYLDNPDVLSAFDIHWSDYEQEYLHDDDCVYLNYLGDYVPDHAVVSLDVDYQHDSYALDDDTKKVVLYGETLTVYKSYDGPVDENEDEDEDEDDTVASAQMAA